jgi:hypothetical protein
MKLKDSLRGQARKQYRQGVPVHDQLRKLFEVLDTAETMTYKKVLFDSSYFLTFCSFSLIVNHLSLTLSEQFFQVDSEILKCLVWSDDRLRDGRSTSSYCVLSADVTFGAVQYESGFSKTSMINGITGAHEVKPLVFTLLTNEDTVTFLHELDFLIEQDPTLPFRTSYWFVDGDEARISAIKQRLPNAIIFLCLFHLFDNFINHVGSSMKARNGVGSRKATLLVQLNHIGVTKVNGLNTQDLEDKMKEVKKKMSPEQIKQMESVTEGGKQDAKNGRYVVPLYAAKKKNHKKNGLLSTITHSCSLTLMSSHSHSPATLTRHIR